ncbi:hypothetical protein KEM52_004100 [Ascosphaera acerosa]|nr:hypothetical protein KEM52_004100 [Ascosphaera acerosa]
MQPNEYPSFTPPDYSRGRRDGSHDHLPPPYAAFEQPCAELCNAFHAYAVQPALGEISTRPHHIPYSQEDFTSRTGRNSLEVLEYTFQTRGYGEPVRDCRGLDQHGQPGWCRQQTGGDACHHQPEQGRRAGDLAGPRKADDEKIRRVAWDHQTGLVRITDLFKAFKLGKGEPGRALDANPGLRELAHNVKGGQVVAQGYWLPFEAARALAATFCFRLRWLLVPVFGPEFVQLCARHGDPMPAEYREGSPPKLATDYVINHLLIEGEHERLGRRQSPSTPPSVFAYPSPESRRSVSSLHSQGQEHGRGWDQDEDHRAQALCSGRCEDWRCDGRQTSGMTSRSTPESMQMPSPASTRYNSTAPSWRISIPHLCNHSHGHSQSQEAGVAAQALLALRSSGSGHPSPSPPRYDDDNAVMTGL